MTKVGVVGASGRTGAFVVQSVGEGTNTVLCGAVVSARSAKLGCVVHDTGVQYSSELGALLGSEVVIDFSTPDNSIAVAEWCAAHRVPVLIGTTGHSVVQLEQLKRLATQIPIALTPNTSLGAAALIALTEQAKKLLGPGFDIEVLEIHHRMKKDAPSGTARAIVNPISGGDTVVFGREGLRREREIGVVSLRGGDVCGDHTVYFLGHGERIELSHRVSSRAVFGQGAVRLAVRLVPAPAGVYSARDLLARTP
jgi:4-hydroxy-tetrahydrodipicolinate reductase